MYFQEETLEVDCLKLKQAQHQQLLFELKTQLRKVTSLIVVFV